MSKVLVTFYSRSGATEVVARALASRIGADIYPIRPRTSYAGAGGYLKGIWHTIRRRTPDIDAVTDLSGYSLVVLGSPVWGGRLSAPARSLLKRQGSMIRALAVFCVSGSGAMQAGAFQEAASLSGRPLLASLTLAEREVRKGAFEPRLGKFVGQILAATP